MDSSLIIQIVLMIAVFYFLLIMPQQKRAKKEKAFEQGIKVGDKVITKSGIHGKIAELAADSVVIETMAGKIKMERNSISMEMSSKMNAQK
ncbi:preprotein translocase subunit YajC [Flavobacterium gelidilacus]|jgi:preprotein translocase subunit YajC|uniref:preprotein translocase subunit YajC n=1 Tax=Flavobacterium gelidilacus TaxID=206041 RepID=UPI0003F592E8|nr:preprotein translocase subunit YajC [Flavobacterium gelidilacus]|tara:strand:- start:233 stop:505 length:273 start_codon:yes stop_codon:yes gene_type:complete